MNLLKTFSKAINNSASLTQEYTDQELEYLKLKVFYHLAKISVGLVKKLVLGIVFLLFFFFCSIALSLYLGAVIGSTPIGFLITAGIYLVIGLIMYIRRHGIEKYVVKKLSSNYFQI